MLEPIGFTALDEITLVLASRANAALERGAVLRFPEYAFAMTPAERRMVASGEVLATAKNISFDGNGLKGIAPGCAAEDTLSQMMARYASFAEALVRALNPGYRAGLTRGRTSFRPTEILGRKTSWRADDTRRHVDAFPASPTQGARILRVFANIDPAQPRVWRIGPDFAEYAARFLPRVPRAIPGAASLLALAGITKTRRTRYDEVMLALHDTAKRDAAWQATAPAETVEFLPGETWMVFTDQMPHAAIAGRNALEQTFLVQPEVLAAPENAPAAILARLAAA